MTDQFLGEIRAFGFNFAPYQWALCDGQILPISQYAALFSLLGTSYGGNGTTNFGLPNMMGRVPMQWGNGAGLSSYVVGESAGSATETININQMPSHNHVIQVATPASGTSESTPGPSPTTWLGLSNPADAYTTGGSPNIQLSQKAISPTGNTQPHQNMQPYLTVNFCIALSGVFPTRG